MIDLRQLQEKNCRGCLYSNPEKVGTGKPCCSYPGVPHLDNDKCLTREEDKADMNDFNPSAIKRHLTDGLLEKGFSKEAAEENATKLIGSMGATKTKLGLCPLGKVSAIACMFCSYGHMTACHYPMRCDEAGCGHYDETEEE